MAFIMSLFTDAEMMGAASSAANSSASVCTVDSAVVPNGSVPRTEAQAQSFSVLSEPAIPQIVEVVARLGSEWGNLLNPCVQCRYRGLCDDDYCAMLCHPIDMSHAPSARGWRRYGI